MKIFGFIVLFAICIMFLTPNVSASSISTGIYFTADDGGCDGGSCPLPDDDNGNDDGGCDGGSCPLPDNG